MTKMSFIISHERNTNSFQLINVTYQFVLICQDFQSESKQCQILKARRQIVTIYIIHGALEQNAQKNLNINRSKFLIE